MKVTRFMFFKTAILLLMLYAFTAPAGIVHAETQYVSDELIITLREGRGNEYKIIKMLKSGTPLEIIEEDELYLKVRTRGGIEGWVLKQYMTDETPKSDIIAGLEKQMEHFNGEIERYKKANESLQNELKSAEADHDRKITDLKQSVSASKGMADQTGRELREITRKYNALVKDSGDVINLVQERDGLKVSSTELQNDNERLKAENDDLRRSQMIWWFVAGAGVFFVGWIVGKISRQKRFY